MKKILYLIIILTPLITLAKDPKIDSKKVYKIKTIMKLEMTNDIAKQIIYHGKIDFLQHTIDTLSIAELNKNELRILRNAIFARYDYIFKSNDLSKHFKQFKWYKPRHKEVKSKLNKIDRLNITRIKSFENINSKMKDVLKNIQLKGVWHVVSTMPAGWARRFIFFNEKKFSFYYSQMRDLPYISSFSGTFDISGNRLKLFVTKKEVLKSECKVYDSSCCGYQWVKPVYINKKLKKTIIMEFPLSNIFTNDKEAMNEEQEVLKIGGIKYYKMGSDPEFGVE